MTFERVADGEHSAEGRRRNIYWVTRAVRQLITSNSDKLRLINAGVRVLGRIDPKKHGSGTLPPARVVQDVRFCLSIS